MTNHPKKDSQKELENIFQMALISASDALTNLLTIPIQVKQANIFTDIQEHTWLDDYASATQYYALRTEVIGDFSALNYLIFSEDDAALLTQLLLNSNQQNSDAMKNSLLMEMDNIVSASVVVALSDKYQLKVHGDVPTLEILNKENLKKYLEQELQNFSHSLTLNTYFEAEGQQLKPQFIWYFDQIFWDLLASVHPNFNLT